MLFEVPDSYGNFPGIKHVFRSQALLLFYKNRYIFMQQRYHYTYII